MKDNAKSAVIISDMTVGNIPKQLVRFSFPFIVANLLQAFYSIVDMAIVGRYVGSIGLSAVSISGQVMMLLTLVGMAFSSSGQILIGQLIGAKDQSGVAASIYTLLTAISAVAILLFAVGLCIYPYALKLLNTPPKAMNDALDYLRICCWGIFFIFAYNGICGILRGLGDSKRPLLFIAASSAVNLVLDILFVAVMGMGTKGAAAATVVGQAIAFGMALLHIYRQREELGISFQLRNFRPDPRKLFLLAKLGAPLALMQICINVSMLILTASINEYGLVAAAVNGVGTKLYSVVTTISNAMSTATATMVAQNIGARKTARAARAVWSALLIVSVVALVLSGVSWFFPRQVFGLFNRDPAVLDMAVDYMRISILVYVSFNLMAPLLGLIQGIGAAQLSLAVAILDSVAARLGLSFLLANTFGMGLYGFFLGTGMAGFVSVIIPGIFFLSGKWKTFRLI